MNRVEGEYFPTDCTTFSNLSNTESNIKFVDTELLLPGDILDAVSYEFGVPVEALTGKRKLKPIREAREEAYYFLYPRCRSLKETARLTGRVNHTTVISGLKQAKLLISTRDDFRWHIDNLRNKFNGICRGN